MNKKYLLLDWTSHLDPTMKLNKIEDRTGRKYCNSDFMVSLTCQHAHVQPSSRISWTSKVCFTLWIVWWRCRRWGKSFPRLAITRWVCGWILRIPITSGRRHRSYRSMEVISTSSTSVVYGFLRSGWIHHLLD